MTGRPAWRQNAHRSAASRGYDSEWRTLRAAVLQAEPACRGCGGVATHVDHVEPLARRPDLRLDRANLQPLCWACHRAKTQREASPGSRRAAERHPGARGG